VTAGATLLVYSLSRAATHGWGDAVTVATLVSALGLLVVFVAIEALSRQPLMPLRIFTNRNRSAAYVLSLAIGATLSGMLFLLTLFLQNVLRFSPLQAGFAFLPTALGVAVGATITSRLIGRIGPRAPMTLGALLVAVGLFWLSGVTVSAGYASHVLGPLVVLAVGLGMVFVSTSVVAISGVTPVESGLASALLNVGRQLGGSLGIAVLGTVAATVASNQLAYGTAFEVASVIAFAGFLVALTTVRGPRVSVSPKSNEIAA
jgi:predicted MFS family arabinose efflux permease